jgi:hypothetical protein
MANYNYPLKYRTFDQILEDVRIDFPKLDAENMIEPQQLIKVVKRVNYDLGLRIFSTKEKVLEVERGRVRLPEDFYVMNFALVCGQHTVRTVLPQGTHVEERQIIPEYKCPGPEVIDTCTPEPVPSSCPPCGDCDPCRNAKPCTQCIKPKVCLSCKGDCYELVQIVKTETRVYSYLFPLHLRKNPADIDCDCPNLGWNNCRNEAWIKDGWLFTNFKEGKVYINYQGNMEDDEGNLLAPDHDMINEYYEYAIKKRILENQIMNDETVSQAKIQLIEDGYRKARVYALTIVNTPNFSEMRKLMEVNRKAQYHKYYNMFKSYDPHGAFGFNGPVYPASR